MKRCGRTDTCRFRAGWHMPLARQCSGHVRERLGCCKCAVDGCRNYCPSNRRSTNGHPTDQHPTLRSSVARYYRRRDVDGISGIEAFHVVCKEVKAAASAGKVVATFFCDMQGSFRRCHAAWWGGDCSGISDDVTTPEEKVRRRRPGLLPRGEVATA
jgi:hypothetical protein